MMAEARNHVLLIGDKNNCDYCRNWFYFDTYRSVKFENFRRSYRHMSSNSELFELTCFQRYFYLYEFMKREGLKCAVMADSDLLIFCDLDSYFKRYNCGCAFSISRRQEPYIWAACPQCCYWTLECLCEFIEYLCSFYDTDIKILQEKYTYAKTQNKKGGICDMTALYLWGRERKDILNLSIEREHMVFDHSLQSRSNYFSDEFRFCKLLKMKRLYYIENIPYFKTTDGKLIKAATIHCQGSSKDIMSLLCQKPNMLLLAGKRYAGFAGRIGQRLKQGTKRDRKRRKICL